MSLTVTIDGLDKFKTLLSPATFQRAVGEGIDKASAFLRDEVKRMPPVSAKTTGYGAKGIPVATGLTRQSIQKKRVALMAAEVFAGTRYSGFVHQGTSRMPARPFFEWELNEFGGLQKVGAIMAQTLSSHFGAK